MSDKQDPELRAMAGVLRALDPLPRDAQIRVMSYVGEKLRSALSFSVTDLMVASSEGFNAINEAAAQITRDGSEPGVSGAQLVAVLVQAYQDAAQTARETAHGEPDAQ